MKKLFLSLSLAFLSLCLFAQTKPETSEAFKEPEGWTKLVQIRNGNTGLIEITKRKGMNFTLYGADRKVIYTGKLALTKVGEKMGGPSSVPAIYDIGGNVAMFVLFFADGEKWLVPTLFRVVIDGKTGALLEETKVLELKEFTMDDNNEATFGEKGIPIVHVEKDPNSDHYAVVGNNTMSPDLNKVISILHFNGDHKQIGQGFVNLPNSKYKYVNYLGTYVHKDQFVMVGAYAYNTEKTGGEEVKYFLSKLEKNASVSKEINYNTSYKEAKCRFVYNKVKDNVMMILSAVVKDDEKNMVQEITFHTIHPAAFTIDPPVKGDFSKMSDYYANKMNVKGGFGGAILGTSVTGNGNLIVLFQNIGKLRLNPGSSPTTKVPFSKWTVRQTYLGNIGLTLFSPEGKAIDGMAMNYAIERSGDIEAFAYDDARKGRKPPFGMQDPGFGASWYFGLDFVATDNANYIFCNITSENFEKPETERYDLTKAISGTNAIKYEFRNKGFSKDYLFGAPADKKSNKFCNFTASSYDPATKTYCTIMLDAKDKKNYVAWFKLD